MALKSYTILITLLFLSYSVQSDFPIGNLNDPAIQSLAKFLVTTYNSRLHEKTSYNHLDYIKTVKGEYIEGGGDDEIIYHLTLEAKKIGDGSLGNYEGRVIYVPWFNIKTYLYLVHV